MDILAKHGGIKGDPEPPTVNISIAYTTIKMDYSKQQTRSKLLKAGFSETGIDELKNARPLNNLKDRQIAAVIIGKALK